MLDAPKKLQHDRPRGCHSATPGLIFMDSGPSGAEKQQLRLQNRPTLNRDARIDHLEIGIEQNYLSSTPIFSYHQLTVVILKVLFFFFFS